MKNIKIKILFIQWIGIIFFINGVQKIYLLFQAKKYACILTLMNNPNDNCWNRLSKNETIGDFVSDFLFWFFYAFIFGIIILSLLNWRYKIHFLNTFLVSIFAFVLFPLNFFRSNIIFNSFWGVFTDNIVFENLTRAIIFTVIAIILAIVSLKIDKKNPTNI